VHSSTSSSRLGFFFLSLYLKIIKRKKKKKKKRRTLLLLSCLSGCRSTISRLSRRECCAESCFIFLCKENLLSGIIKPHGDESLTIKRTNATARCGLIILPPRQHRFPVKKGRLKRPDVVPLVWTVWNRMGPNSHWRFFLFSSWRKVRQLATHVRSYARTVVTRQICMRLPTMRFWSGIFHKLIAISLRQLRLSLSTLPVETKSFSFLQTCVDEVFNEVYSFLVVESWSTECGLRLIGQIPRFQLTVVAGRYAVSLLRV
jgi:hypothetical protein